MQHMDHRLIKDESDRRVAALYKALDAIDPGWDTALVANRINQYYFTGTMQDGLLVIRRNGGACLFVRRSYERAVAESPFGDIRPMRSYRDILGALSPDLGNTLVETECVPIAMMERLKKYFRFADVLPLDAVVTGLRSVKSDYELSFFEEAGKRHNAILTEIVPGLLREGMSEAQLMADMYREMVRLGHQGLIRFSGFQSAMPIGMMGFGESTLAPTSFDGPGGMRGMAPAVPFMGSNDRLLKKGDLVFMDMAFGYFGYHTDKTQVYSFRGRPDEKAVRMHEECMRVQRRTADMLRPGAIPSEIYDTIVSGISEELMENFMGYGNRRVQFLGHGIGLYVDEYPVIARGFDAPLEKGMVVALEPKTGVAGAGTVGVEETYVVADEGGRCLTGGPRGILEV